MEYEDVKAERTERMGRWSEHIAAYCLDNQIQVRSIEGDGVQYRRAETEPIITWWLMRNTVYVQHGPTGERYEPQDDQGPLPRILRCLRATYGDICPVCGEPTQIVTVACHPQDGDKFHTACGHEFERHLWTACRKCGREHHPFEDCPPPLVDLRVGYDAGIDDFEQSHFMPHEPESD